MKLRGLRSQFGPEAGRRRFVLLPGAGAIAALGHAPISLPIFTLLGFAVSIAAFVTCKSWRQATLFGWLFALGYFAFSLSWLVEPFLVDASRDGWMAPFALAAMTSGLALFWAAAFAAAWWLGRSDASRTIALAVAMTLAGLLREVFMTGFPWALPAYVWAETPVAQSLAWYGPHGLTFVTVLAAGAWCSMRQPWLGWLLTLVGIAALWILGEARLHRGAETSENLPMVRIVQPNVPQELKWDRGHSQQFFDRLITMTAADVPENLVAVIWPETAATFLLREEERISAIAGAARGALAVIGIRRRTDSRQFNSLAVIDSLGSIVDIYDKRRLVPFGEYVPLANQIESIGLEGLASRLQGRFDPGSGDRFLDLGVAGRWLALICYESIFPRDIRRNPRPDGLLHVTNDGWFGTWSGPQQHFVQARMRAIELGLPLIRAANTGISAMVDGKGRVLHSLPVDVSGKIDVPLPRPLRPTLYSQTGDLPLMIVLLTWVGMVLRYRLYP